MVHVLIRRLRQSPKIGLIILAVILLSSLSSITRPIDLIVDNSTTDSSSQNDVLYDDLPINQYEKSAVIDMNSVNYSVYNTPEAFDGYTLYVLYRRNRGTGSYTNSLVVMDMNGEIIAEKDVGIIGSYNCPAEFIDPDTVLVGTSNGPKLWHISSDTMEPVGHIGHHEYEYNPNSNTIFTFATYVTNINGTDYQFDYIREYSMSGSLVWTMDVHDFIPADWWCPFGDMQSGLYRDVSHSNTIFYDADEDIIYYNSRNTNTFFKIDHGSKKVIWGLGEHGNFSLFNIDGNPRECLFYHAHSVERVDDNTFIIFDNDMHNQTDPNNMISRMIEIQINEDTMTANETWVYAAPADYYSTGWGDADRLPNGNRIGCFGYPTTPSSGLSAAFVEVNEQGDVVWETRFYYNETYLYGIYRLERFRTAPIITPAPDIPHASPTPTISWDVYYNYRNKEELPGEYKLYLDGLEIDTGNFTYAKFWRPTTLSLSPGELENGSHNVTLVISDGYGNTQSDTVNVTVNEFYVHRTGYTTVEKGQSSMLPTWSGQTLEELQGNITLNGILYMSFNWTGQDIVLDPDLISLGVHEVFFSLYNSSTLLYSDSFLLYVTPAEAPVISPMQSNILSIGWNTPLTLFWNLTDVTGDTWQVWLNGSLIEENSWSPPSFLLNWSLPTLWDGIYNITVVAEDLLGLKTSDVCWLTVNQPTTPVFLTTPEDTTIEWGSDDVVFTWEIYGGTHWRLYKDGVQIRSGNVASDSIEIAITDWRGEDWRPGNHTLELYLYLGAELAIDVFTVTVVANMGDCYVDAIITERSEWYSFGDNVIGAPDDLYTIIFVDYTNGYVTLDMGEDEEIIDGTGFDFTVWAEGDNYSVYVSDSLDTTFQLLGTAIGTDHFDLSMSNFNQTRYVRIELHSGVSVSIDAITALHYNVPPSDVTSPNISSVDDFSMKLNDGSSIVTWNVSDLTPWNYEIYVNSVLVQSGWWNGSDISFEFEPDAAGFWNVTLIVYDAFGNSASDTVVIEVIPPPESIVFPLIITATTIGVGIVVVIVLYRKYRLSGS